MGESPLHVLLAMQKVEGSNPFSRFTKGLQIELLCTPHSTLRVARTV